MLTINQLKQYANKFLMENYHMYLDVPLRLNGRMKTTFGWFRHQRNGAPLSVELNKYFVENNEATVVIDVLKHELCHYALFMQGRPYKDGQSEFENELKRLNIISQSTIDKYKIATQPRKIQVYQCSKCSAKFNRQRALPNNGRGHRCSCGGNLQDKGKIVKVS